VKISFCDARLCRVFNSYRLLREQYGPELAESISIRMGVLVAAPKLAAVPTRPPIGLRAEEGAFTVDLVRARRLRFQPTAKDGTSPPDDPRAISSIEILGVEGEPRRPRSSHRHRGSAA
jgi:hypothetical protein